LWTHLYRKHREAHDKLKQKDANNNSKKGKRPTASSSEAGDNKKQCLMSVFMPKRLDASKKQAYDLAVLKFVVADGRPFETAAGVGFQNLCAVITDGAYKPPHPTTLSRKLNDLSVDLKQKFIDKLKSEIGDSRPSITFDHWKADNDTNYLVLTVHYISDSWKIESRCLSVVNLENLDADHTSAKTAEIITEEFAKHNIEAANIFFATTDTTNTMPRTARLIDVQWHHCAAHSLQLAINAAVDVQRGIQNLIGHAHVIAGFFHSSTVGQSVLAKYQNDKGVPESRPPVDVTTRFNSTFTLLKWAQKNAEPVSLALVDCSMNRKNKCAKTPPQPLSQPSQELLKNVLPLLQPAAEATSILSADANVSASLVIPCISVLKERLAKRSTSVFGIQVFRQELLRQLQTRFDLSKMYLKAATFVDPRFKTVLLSENETKEAITYVKTLAAFHSGSSATQPLPVPDDRRTAVSDANTEAARGGDDVDTEQEQQGSQTVEAEELPEQSLLNSVFKKVDSAQRVNNVSNQFDDMFDNEVSMYLKQPVIERASEPLQYWKDNKSLLPLLSTAARDLLAIQATNCSSERVNSVGGQIITDNRNSLSRTNAETLMWARHNRHIIC